MLPARIRRLGLQNVLLEPHTFYFPPYITCILGCGHGDIRLTPFCVQARRIILSLTSPALLGTLAKLAVGTNATGSSATFPVCSTVIPHQEGSTTPLIRLIPKTQGLIQNLILDLMTLTPPHVQSPRLSLTTGCPVLPSMRTRLAVLQPAHRQSKGAISPPVIQRPELHSVQQWIQTRTKEKMVCFSSLYCAVSKSQIVYCIFLTHRTPCTARWSSNSFALL